MEVRESERQSLSAPILSTQDTGVVNDHSTMISDDELGEETSSIGSDDNSPHKLPNSDLESSVSPPSPIPLKLPSSDLDSSVSPPSPIPSEITFSETSSVDVDEFLGHADCPSPKHKTFKIVGDNIDKNMRPRDMITDHQVRSLHYFHSYTVCDRLDLSDTSKEVPVPDVPSLNVQNLLPTSSDESCMTENFSILIARTLVKYVPYFEKLGPCLEIVLYIYIAYCARVLI